jgi:hypothetical protein
VRCVLSWPTGGDSERSTRANLAPAPNQDWSRTSPKQSRRGPFPFDFGGERLRVLCIRFRVIPEIEWYETMSARRWTRPARRTASAVSRSRRIPPSRGDRVLNAGEAGLRSGSDPATGHGGAFRHPFRWRATTSSVHPIRSGTRNRRVEKPLFAQAGFALYSGEAAVSLEVGAPFWWE